LRTRRFAEKLKDAILLFEEESEEAVKTHTDSLPLVTSNLIEYEIIGLLAYSGLGRLRHGTNQ